jgi:acyl carrier protein
MENFYGLSPSTAAKKAEEIWRTELAMPEGRADLTFFELSGQSIAAVRIAARLEEELGVVVDIGDLFEDPDMDGFVRHVVGKLEGARG